MGGSGETQNHETGDGRLPSEKIGGGNATGITSGRLLLSPSGVSISTNVKTSTISIIISITIFVIHFIPLIV